MGKLLLTYLMRAQREKKAAEKENVSSVSFLTQERFALMHSQIVIKNTW